MFTKNVPKIGVALIVRNNFGAAHQSLREWRAKLPKGASLVVIDDGSKEPFPDADFRFNQPVGHARAKNRALMELQVRGTEDAFLAEADCFSKSPQWYKPYVESKEPHLVHTPRTFRELSRTNAHVAYTKHSGGLTYLHLPTTLPVGGFDPAFGFGTGEGQDLADRLHAAGLTTWRYADVVDSWRLWSEETRESPIPLNQVHLDNVQGTSRYIPHEESGVNIPTKKNTAFIRIYPSKDITPLTPWLEEIERNGLQGLVISSDITSLPRGYGNTKLVSPESRVTLENRWLHYRDLISRGPDWVWIVDRLNFKTRDDLFDLMTPSKLYARAEPNNVGCVWMKNNHKSYQAQNIMNRHSQMPLLNSAVVGGERSVLLDFASKMNSLCQDIEAGRLEGVKTEDAGDMPLFNGICYDYFHSRVSKETKVFQALNFS